MFYTAHETTWNCYLNISCLLMQLLSTMLDMVYGSDEKEKVLPLLTSIMHNVTPYLKNHRWGLQFPTLIICYFILTMWSRAQVSRPGFEPHPCWSHQNVGLVNETARPRHKKTTTHTTHSGLILYGGNKVTFPPCPLFIALVPLKCSSRNLQFSHRVPSAKEKMPWCPSKMKQTALSMFCPFVNK